MESIEKTLITYEKKLFEKMFCLKHIHPPISGTVPECLYCRIHGNVFENGASSVDTRLQDFVVPVLDFRKKWSNNNYNNQNGIGLICVVLCFLEMGYKADDVRQNDQKPWDVLVVSGEQVHEAWVVRGRNIVIH